MYNNNMVDKNNLLIVIQARQNSTRLKNKVLMDLNGKSVVQRVWDRLGDKYQKIIVTGDKYLNQELIKHCIKFNMHIIPGSEDDVLSRFKIVAGLYRPEWIVRITSDNPLISSLDIDNVIRYSNISDHWCKYITNIYMCPIGFDVQLFKTSILNSKHTHIEHVINPELRLNKLHASCMVHKNELKYRLTLDNIEDYKLICKIYNSGKAINNMFDILDLINDTEEFKKLAIENGEKFKFRATNFKDV